MIKIEDPNDNTDNTNDNGPSITPPDYSYHKPSNMTRNFIIGIVVLFVIAAVGSCVHRHNVAEQQTITVPAK